MNLSAKSQYNFVPNLPYIEGSCLVLARVLDVSPAFSLSRNSAIIIFVTETSLLHFC